MAMPAVASRSGLTARWCGRAGSRVRCRRTRRGRTGGRRAARRAGRRRARRPGARAAVRARRARRGRARRAARRGSPCGAASASPAARSPAAVRCSASVRRSAPGRRSTRPSAASRSTVRTVAGCEMPEHPPQPFDRLAGVGLQVHERGGRAAARGQVPLDRVRSRSVAASAVTPSRFASRSSCIVKAYLMHASVASSSAASVDLVSVRRTNSTPAGGPSSPAAVPANCGWVGKRFPGALGRW